MDPVSIVIVAVVGGMVFASFVRFVRKTYYSYQSNHNDHGVEMTTEETTADGASKKVTLKFHGKSHEINIIDHEHKEHGDPDAIKALSSLASFATGVSSLSSINQVTHDAPSVAAQRDNEEHKEKHSIMSEAKKGLSVAVNALKKAGSRNEDSKEKQASPNNVSHFSLDTQDHAINSEIKDSPSKPISSLYSPSINIAKFKGASKVHITNSNKEEETKDNSRKGDYVVSSSKATEEDSKEDNTSLDSSGSDDYFDAHDVDRVRPFREVDLSSSSMSGDANNYASFSNEF